MKDLKKIDPQETEEQQKHQKVEKIGSKDPSKFWQTGSDPHRGEDCQKENEIIFSKQSRVPSLAKLQ